MVALADGMTFLGTGSGIRCQVGDVSTAGKRKLTPGCPGIIRHRRRARRLITVTRNYVHGSPPLSQISY